jgi:hypothetical protein
MRPPNSEGLACCTIRAERRPSGSLVQSNQRRKTGWLVPSNQRRSAKAGSSKPRANAHRAAFEI